MKLSKSLLQAIALGITIGSTTACVGTLQKIEDTAQEEQQIEHENKPKEVSNHLDNCPACGRG